MTTATIGRVLVLEKAEIEKILPHQGKMLLLDRVEIGPERVRGELTVTEEVCEGHAVLDGKLVMRGSDLYDMAAQLLAVWLAGQHPELVGRTCLVREYGSAKLKAPISPFEEIIIEMPVVAEMEGERHSLLIVTGSNFIVQDKRGTVKARIEKVKLVVA